MGPDERIEQATTRLDELETLPVAVGQTVDALVHKIDTRLAPGDETAQEWRDVVETARTMDKSSASDVASLMRTVRAAPTTPPPPRGWLSVDMAVLDVAKAVDADSEAVATA